MRSLPGPGLTTASEPVWQVWQLDLDILAYTRCLPVSLDQHPRIFNPIRPITPEQISLLLPLSGKGKLRGPSTSGSEAARSRCYLKPNNAVRDQ